MTNVHIVYYGFTFLCGVIAYISIRNIYKNWTANNTLMILMWASLLAFAILHWTQVSAHTDADTIALYWMEGKLRDLWATIDQIKMKNGLAGRIP